MSGVDEELRRKNCEELATFIELEDCAVNGGPLMFLLNYYHTHPDAVHSDLLMLVANREEVVLEQLGHPDPESCGTVGCIRGFCQELLESKKLDGTIDAVDRFIFQTHEEMIKNRFRLFDPDGGYDGSDAYVLWKIGVSYESVTRDMAAKVVRHYGETGIVAWSIIKGDVL